MNEIRLAWRSNKSGFEGRGSVHAPEDRKLLEAWAEAMNKKYPDIRHWVESGPKGWMEVQA